MVPQLGSPAKHQGASAARLPRPLAEPGNGVAASSTSPPARRGAGPGLAEAGCRAEPGNRGKRAPGNWGSLLGGRPLAWAGLVAGLAAGLAWSYWPTLGQLAHEWAHDPQYSHGYLVPGFALVLLWLRRDRIAGAAPALGAWGVLLLAAAAGLRLAGTFLFISWVESLSFIAALAGVCVLLGGRQALRWAWPALGFLLFMLPLPYQLQSALGHPLQRIATGASTYALQTLGLPAFAEGNIILVDDLTIGVSEACNGLSMLVVFFALSTAVALVIRRPPWQKGVIVVSAIPVAVVSNVARITVTALLFEVAGSEAARRLFHDWAGWLMIPLALCILWAELGLLPCLLLKPAPARARLATNNAGPRLHFEELKACPSRKRTRRR